MPVNIIHMTYLRRFHLRKSTTYSSPDLYFVLWTMCDDRISNIKKSIGAHPNFPMEGITFRWLFVISVVNIHTIPDKNTRIIVRQRYCGRICIDKQHFTRNIHTGEFIQWMGSVNIHNAQVSLSHEVYIIRTCAPYT